MASIFTKIIQGEIPSYKIAENEHYYSFLDIAPTSKGHTLVIPKIEEDYLFDLDSDTLGGILEFARPIAKAIDKAFGTIRTGVIVEGLLVPHAHVHLVPIYSKDQLVALGQHKEEFSAEEMAEIAAQIRKEL